MTCHQLSLLQTLYNKLLIRTGVKFRKQVYRRSCLNGFTYIYLCIRRQSQLLGRVLGLPQWLRKNYYDFLEYISILRICTYIYVCNVWSRCALICLRFKIKEYLNELLQLLERFSFFSWAHITTVDIISSFPHMLYPFVTYMHICI